MGPNGLCLLINRISLATLVALVHGSPYHVATCVSRYPVRVYERTGGLPFCANLGGILSRFSPRNRAQVQDEGHEYRGGRPPYRYSVEIHSMAVLLFEGSAL
jgi:hypothetical protein